MKLYDYTMAPNPRRVRIFLAEKGIEIEKVQVDIPAGENLAPEFRAINPRGLLPTLVLDDGHHHRRVRGHLPLFRVAASRPPPLIGTDAKTRAVVASAQRHMEFDGLQSVADAFRNANPTFANRSISGSEGVPAVPGLVERGQAAAARFYTSLNDTLASPSSWLAMCTASRTSRRYAWWTLRSGSSCGSATNIPTSSVGTRLYRAGQAPAHRRHLVIRAHRSMVRLLPARALPMMVVLQPWR